MAVRVDGRMEGLWVGGWVGDGGVLRPVHFVLAFAPFGSSVGLALQPFLPSFKHHDHVLGLLSFSLFLGLHLRHMETPRLGVQP